MIEVFTALMIGLFSTDGSDTFAERKGKVKISHAPDLQLVAERKGKKKISYLNDVALTAERRGKVKI